MLVRSLDSWISQLTEDKLYKVMAIHQHYYLIEEDSGRLAWNYERLFEVVQSDRSDLIKVNKPCNYDIL